MVAIDIPSNIESDREKAPLVKPACKVKQDESDGEPIQQMEVESDGEKAPLLKPACEVKQDESDGCLLYTSPSPRDGLLSRMPSSA